MKSSCRFPAALLCALLCAVACGPKARIDGVVAQAPQDRIIVKQLDMSDYAILDTVRTDAEGRFSYSVPVKERQPEFIYFFYGDRKIASLLLCGPEKISLQADTSGNYSVQGSPESEKLREVELSSAAFRHSMDSLKAIPGIPSGALTRCYIEYYRDRVRYLLNNRGSMSVLPVLFEKVDDNSPLFSQTTDALHFRMACDTLAKLYPESKYVAALEKETVRREGILSLEQKLANEAQEGYPDISMTGMEGKAISLRSLKNKVVLLYFWNPDDKSQKNFNINVLLPLYEQFHPKGLEVYAVGVTAFKPLWAEVVREQKLPWINVCDALGGSSPAVLSYNVSGTPAAILLSGDFSVACSASGEAGLRRELNRLLY